MKKQLLIEVLLSLGLFACDMDTSYTVRVINSDFITFLSSDLLLLYF